mgnify:CR=1 FL=1
MTLSMSTSMTPSSPLPIENARVLSLAVGIVFLTRRQTRAQARTGHKGKSVAIWERLSIFLPFFWSTKVMVTNLDFVSRSGSSWESFIPLSSRKEMFPSVKGLVFPRFLT